jgi:hypothetical protein
MSSANLKIMVAIQIIELGCKQLNEAGTRAKLFLYHIS